MTRRALLLALTTLTLACASDPDPQPGPRDGTPQDTSQDPDDTDAHADLYDPIRRSAQSWDDPTRGRTATFIYVTEFGNRADKHPGAMLFMSDPSFRDFALESGFARNGAEYVVKRLYLREMSELLQDLDAQGLSSLPWRERPDDTGIDAQRAFYLFERDSFREVVKADLSPAHQRAFTQVERRLIQLTYRVQ